MDVVAGQFFVVIYLKDKRIKMQIFDVPGMCNSPLGPAPSSLCVIELLYLR